MSRRKELLVMAAAHIAAADIGAVLMQPEIKIPDRAKFLKVTAADAVELALVIEAEVASRFPALTKAYRFCIHGHESCTVCERGK